jgi:hypothetical protein
MGDLMGTSLASSGLLVNLRSPVRDSGGLTAPPSPVRKPDGRCGHFPSEPGEQGIDDKQAEEHGEQPDAEISKSGLPWRTPSVLEINAFSSST